MVHERLHRARIALSFVIGLTLATATLAGPYDEAIARFSEFAEQRVEQDMIPGLSIGFVKDDFIWAEGFGWADLENRVPAKAESAYRLASVTKPITAIGVLKLVEQGKIDLDAEVQTYVPYFPRKQWPVTVRQLLGHLGGISHYKNYDLEGHFKSHKNTEESLAVFADFDLVGEPGTVHSYSSYGYNLLGAVIEGASGQSYGEFMREQLWSPLGMDSTRMDDPNAIIPNRVRGYRLGPDGQLIHSEFVDISSRFAAGGTRSTVIDLLHLGKGLNEGRVLKPETMDTMLTSMTTSDGRYTGYGMGWGIRPRNGRFTASHSGGQAETRTFFIWIPSEKLAIAVACNFEGGDRMPYVGRLYQELTGEPVMPQVYAGGGPQQTIHAVLRTTFEEGLSHVERRGGPLTTEPGELALAFAYFNDNVNLEALQSDDEAVRERIGDGRHPKTGRPFTIVGTYVASQLVSRTGADTIARLHRDGPLPFFAEYVQLYRKDKTIPKSYRLEKPLEKLIAKWADDWSRVWHAESWNLGFEQAEDVDARLAEVRTVFGGASIYPDLLPGMESLVETSARAGRMTDALKLANAGRELYPEAPAPHFHAGLVTLAMGSTDDGSKLIRQAHALDPSAASAGNLNNWAYRLKAAGFVDLGLALLKVGVELHPEAANLYDSTGEFLLDKGEREEAVRHYKKALELDPEFDNARRMLEQIGAGDGGS
jgi:CubicO group peptidase (beta-lactamase class C family)/tetratricopeptide (TPR) repeat protein